MLKELNKIVAEIKVGTDNIANTSVTIKDVAGSLASGASTQASSAEEVSASMEEMASIISQTADNASQADKIAMEGAEGIKEGNKSFRTTMEAMNEIAEKITVIGKIAEKTDVLAINAAIEAARAGEHGKGFAVVATEIRKLAENSQKAAKEINEAVSTSLSVTQQSTTMLEYIVPEIEKTARLIQEISTASAEQNSGANQINNAIQELSKVTQQNTNSADIMNEGSKSITEQAEILKKTIAFFKTDIKNSSTKEITTIETEVEISDGTDIILGEMTDNIDDKN